MTAAVGQPAGRPGGATGRRVMFAGGGTGGHVYPALAVAREILRMDAQAQVSFVGTARGLEARVIPREGLALDVIRSAGLKGMSLAGRLRGLALLPLSAWDAWRVLRRRRPTVVVGVGGYSSGPVVLLAAVTGRRTLLMEQNAVPGLTNRLLGRIVDVAAVSFDSALAYFGGRGFVSGNPVRTGVSDLALSATRSGDPLRLLIFGGSQGAHAINVAAAEAATLLTAFPRPLAVTHQTGAADQQHVNAAYENAGVQARTEAFLFDLDREMAAADLVVCRAGATTLAELAAAGRAAILVPLPTAADDHQRRNAGVLAEAGAAEVLDQRNLSGPVLADRITTLLLDDDRRSRMETAVRRLGRPDAARVVAERVLELADAA